MIQYYKSNHSMFRYRGVWFDPEFQIGEDYYYACEKLDNLGGILRNVSEEEYLKTKKLVIID